REDRDPGLQQRDVPVPPVRTEARPEPPKPEPPKPEQLAAITPPARPPELRAPPPAPAPPEKAEEEEAKDAEIIRQRPVPPRRPEPPKPETPQQDALEKLLREQQAEEKQKAEEARKAEEKRRAEEKRKAEEKARREREAREKAEAEKLNEAIRQKLLTSREAPASTGATGAQVSQTASLGTQNATGQKLSPSDRAQLIGILTEQMSRCISYNGTAPKTGPQITFTLGRDGGIISSVQLVNRSPEPNFVPFAEASIRALRNCQPYRIPARFLATYEDWKNVRLNMITDDLR
ncbi:MAG: hypothetical protein LDL22_07495, partial [Hyphomicrobiales bacterium]|nr:hypothetical protein [Hyphomicrobiales bacterium]